MSTAAGSQKQRKRTRTSQDDPYDFDSSSQPGASATGTSKRSRRGAATQDTTASSQPESVPMDEDEPASITDERFNAFKKTLTQLFREARAQSLPMTRFRDYLTEQHSGRPFNSGEIKAAFEKMTDANQVMVADDIIFLI